jgi:hypothetical protein
MPPGLDDATVVEAQRSVHVPGSLHEHRSCSRLAVAGLWGCAIVVPAVGRDFGEVDRSAGEIDRDPPTAAGAIRGISAISAQGSCAGKAGDREPDATTRSSAVSRIAARLITLSVGLDGPVEHQRIRRQSN